MYLGDQFEVLCDLGEYLHLYPLPSTCVHNILFLPVMDFSLETVIALALGMSIMFALGPFVAAFLFNLHLITTTSQERSPFQMAFINLSEDKGCERSAV